MGVDIGIDRCERRADCGLERDDTAKTEWHLKQIGEQIERFTMTQAVAPVQQANQRSDARAKGTCWHIGRSFAGDERVAARTTDGMRVMGLNQRHDQRHVPDLLGLNGADIVTMRGQVITTGRTGRRVVVAGRGDLVRVRVGPLVARMPGLSTRSAPTRHAGGTGRSRGRIRRGRFGGILGMQREARFKLGHADEQVGNLLLMERKGRQQELLHDHRRGSPDFGRNAGR